MPSTFGEDWLPGGQLRVIGVIRKISVIRIESVCSEMRISRIKLISLNNFRNQPALDAYFRGGLATLRAITHD